MRATISFRGLRVTIEYVDGSLSTKQVSVKQSILRGFPLLSAIPLVGEDDVPLTAVAIFKSAAKAALREILWTLNSKRDVTASSELNRPKRRLLNCSKLIGSFLTRMTRPQLSQANSQTLFKRSSLSEEAKRCCRAKP